MATTVDTLLVRIEADMSDLKRDLQRVSRSVESQTSKMSSAFGKVARAVAAIGGAYAFGSFIKSTIQTGAQVEGLKVQLDALLGSAEEGGKAFDMMADFASRVPFSLEDIQSASGSLAAASKDAEQLGHLLQVTGNIAAQFNIPFDQAAENVQRSLSAGAASADLFQQKGVNAFMGFQAGVSYSVEETADVLIATFGHGGTADGAMSEFAETTGGVMSMFGDAVFNARKSMAESGLNDGFKELVAALTDVIKAAQPLTEMIGRKLGAAFSSAAGVMRRVAASADEIGAIFSSLWRIASSVGTLMSLLFGPSLELIFTLLAKAIGWAKTNMNLIVIALGAFISLKAATKVYELASAAIAAAKAFRVLTAAQRAYNLIAKSTTGRIIAIGALALSVTGGIEKFADEVEEIGKRIQMAIPEEFRETFDDIVEDFSYLDDEISNFWENFNSENGKVKIDIADPDIDSVNAAVAALVEGQEALSAAELGFGGPSGADELEEELLRKNKLLGLQTKLQGYYNEAVADGNVEMARQYRIGIEAVGLRMNDASLTAQQAAAQARFNVSVKEASEAQAAYEKSLTDAAAARQRAIDDARALNDEIMGQIPAQDQLRQKIAQYQAVLETTNNGPVRHALINLLPAMREELRMMDEMYATVRNSVEGFGKAASAAFADAVVNGSNMAEALNRAFKSMIAQIIEMAFQLSVINPILNGIFNLTGQAAMPTRSVFGENGILSGLTGKATGGSVTANLPYMVGERGPELFVPHAAGQIVNANNTRSMGGGQTVMVNQTINVETGVSQTVRAEMLSLLPRFKADTMASIVDAKRRGGSFGAAFG